MTVPPIYSNAVNSTIPLDLLPPAKPSYTLLQATQDITAPEGRSIITLNWSVPNTNENVFELLGNSTGSADTLQTTYDPIILGSYTIYEVINENPSGLGNTNLSADANNDNDIIYVDNTANFFVGDIIQINDGGKKGYYKIISIIGNSLVLSSRILNSGPFLTGSVVKTVITQQKVEGLDYTIDILTGIILTNAGQFLNGNDIIIEYQTELQDLSNFAVYRSSTQIQKGNGYSSITLNDVKNFSGTTILDENIDKTQASYTDNTLTEAENGQNIYYYLFALDQSTHQNVSFGNEVLVETLPSVPQNLTSNSYDSRVIIYWDKVKNVNVNGYNVFRSDGDVFDKANAVQINSILIDKDTTSFDDSFANTTNRVESSVVPFPINGLKYTYKVESVDSTTLWDTGTANQTATQLENTVAQRNL
ncbi:MAG: hypothetical protein D6813_13925 [Calditrichaeota bacterium]|nr:MAG: hypothetical protein D6813_13925 [Calditrichota bacterium]